MTKKLAREIIELYCFDSTLSRIAKLYSDDKEQKDNPLEGIRILRESVKSLGLNQEDVDYIRKSCLDAKKETRRHNEYAISTYLNNALGIRRKSVK